MLAGEYQEGSRIVASLGVGRSNQTLFYSDNDEALGGETSITREFRFYG